MPKCSERGLHEIRDKENWRGRGDDGPGLVGSSNNRCNRCVRGQEASGTHLKTYAIGYQGPLSGGNAATGLYEKYGTQLAVKQWNSNKKRKFNIKLVSGDDQGCLLY